MLLSLADTKASGTEGNIWNIVGLFLSFFFHLNDGNFLLSSCSWSLKAKNCLCVAETGVKFSARNHEF